MHSIIFSFLFRKIILEKKAQGSTKTCFPLNWLHIRMHELQGRKDGFVTEHVTDKATVLMSVSMYYGCISILQFV